MSCTAVCYRPAEALAAPAKNSPLRRVGPRGLRSAGSVPVSAASSKPRPAATTRPAASPAPSQAPSVQLFGKRDPERLTRCGAKYARLSKTLREGINERFAGLSPDDPAATASWCDLVDRVFEQGALPMTPSDRVRPAGFVDRRYTTQAACNLAFGAWDATRRECDFVGPDPSATPGATPGATTSGGGGRTGTFGPDTNITDRAACAAAGGNVFQSKGNDWCGSADGSAVPIGGGDGSAQPEEDHTDVIVGGIVQGAVGIAGAIAQVIASNNQREYQQTLASLQMEQSRLALAARAGDNESAQAMGRINLAIAQLNTQAAEANARASAANQPQPFQIQQTPTIPAWVWAVGGVVLAAAIAALIVAVLKNTAPAPPPYAPYGAPYQGAQQPPAQQPYPAR